MPIPKVIFIDGYFGRGDDDIHVSVNDIVQDLIEGKHKIYICDVPGSIKIDYKLVRDADGDALIVAAIFFRGSKRKK